MFGLRQLIQPKHASPFQTLTQGARDDSFSRSETSRRVLTFEQLVFNLPHELVINILYSLTLQELLYLRLVSRSWYTLVTMHEDPLSRHHIYHHVPQHAVSLYPPTSFDLHYLCGLWHRIHVATRLSDLIGAWATKELFLLNTEAKRNEFAMQSHRMWRRLIPLVFTIYHFFERYRDLHIEYLERNNGIGLRHAPHTFNPIELDIMSLYDDQTILRVHEVFPLFMSAFCRRLRPPTYVGRVERSFRGYLREPPSEDLQVAILILGGLGQAEKFWVTKGYNARRNMVDAWHQALIKPQIDANIRSASNNKPRRPFMGLGRKRRLSNDDKKKGFGSDPRNDPTRTSVLSSKLNSSSGMGSPTPKYIHSVLSDLPVLQHIWLLTAEAVIISRKIVAGPHQIKRNTQVLFELIREDGYRFTDEWTRGFACHLQSSHRPDYIDDDLEIP
jgi:hypothetical protein